MYFLSFSASIFGAKHLIILGISLVLTVIVSIFGVKKLKMKQFHRLLLIVGIASEVIKAFTYIVHNAPEYGGYLNKSDLPFHMCSMQIILIAILNFSKNEKLKRVIYSYMMPTCFIGGIGAMAVCTWSSINLWTITFTYYPYHILLSAFAVYLFFSKEFKPTIKDYRNGLLMFFGVIMAAIYINAILYTRKIDSNGNVVFENINFMYVINPPTSGLPLLNKNYSIFFDEAGNPIDSGWPVYIAHYLFLAFFACSLIYIKPIIDYFKTFINKKKEIKEQK